MCRAKPPCGLARDRSAVALIEFAYSLPIFLTLGMYGIELAYMATVNMQVSQIAMALADNASRPGQTDNSAVSPTITNKDIDSILSGAMQQGANAADARLVSAPARLRFRRGGQASATI